MAIKKQTNVAILDVAEYLLQKVGYNGFSYKHIASALGIRNAAIHYHFASKTDLGIALVQRYRLRFQDWARLVAEISDRPDVQLEAYFDLHQHYVRAGDRICPCGILGAEFGAIPDEMRAEVQGLVAELCGWLEGTLQQGRDGGQFQFTGTAEDEALIIGAALQGGLQITRVLGADSLDRFLDQIRHNLLASDDRDHLVAAAEVIATVDERLPTLKAEPTARELGELLAA